MTDPKDAPSASAAAADDNADDYCSKYLSPEIVEKLEAAAFRSLCQHLQERSDQVQNMELMTMSGFCRNCLAKWMVLEARQMVDRGGTISDADNTNTKLALDAFGYEEAAHHVYGMTYGDWKKRHQKKATDEQMERYNASKDLQAKHDKELLATRSSVKPPPVLASNVCCQDVDEPPATSSSKKGSSSNARTVGPFQPPPLPTANLPEQLCVGVLTVSDRAAKNEYEHGDLSGPAVVEAINNVLGSSAEESKVSINASTTVAIVPDDAEAIQAQLKAWTASDTTMHLILTTGGTGFGARDVTPEATRAVLDQECTGLMAFVTTECSQLQPLASLSRGIAGFCGKTMIANLPGNPKGVSEVVPVLLPVLLHAVADLQSSSQ